MLECGGCGEEGWGVLAGDGIMAGHRGVAEGGNTTANVAVRGGQEVEACALAPLAVGGGACGPTGGTGSCERRNTRG